MRQHCLNLGIKRDLYPLFACMLTGRPWESVVAGINKTPHSSSEVSHSTNFLFRVSTPIVFFRPRRKTSSNRLPRSCCPACPRFSNRSIVKCCSSSKPTIWFAASKQRSGLSTEWRRSSSCPSAASDRWLLRISSALSPALTDSVHTCRGSGPSFDWTSCTFGWDCAVSVCYRRCGIFKQICVFFLIYIIDMYIYMHIYKLWRQKFSRIEIAIAMQSTLRKMCTFVYIYIFVQYN